MMMRSNDGPVPWPTADDQRSEPAGGEVTDER